jgi:inosose dehydratase
MPRAEAIDSPLFDRSIIASPEFKIAYHAITWGNDLQQAISDISALSFRGIQIRRDDYQLYANRASELKDLLAEKRLTLVSISTGGVTLKPETEKQEIEDRVKMASFMRQVGGLYLQATDSARNRTGLHSPDDYKKLGRRLTEIGKRTMDLGIKLGYHNHMNSLGESREEVDRIFDATDQRAVWVLPDIAHMQAAGGDPIRFARDYLNRIVYPHFKDVITHPAGPAAMDGTRPRPRYDFVELGQGKVNLPGVLQIMKDYNYRGWIVVELDRAPAGRTPKESAEISKRYIEEKLKLKV